MNFYPLYDGFSRVWSLRRLLLSSPSGTRWLMYHAIGSDVPDDDKKLYSITADQFEQQAQWLSRTYPAVATEEKNLNSQQGVSIGITFDDGYRDNLYVAAPILQRYQLPFSVFVIADAVRRRDRLFLSATDIRRLISEYDVVIGSHGATHVPLTRCNDIRLREELTSSKHYLEDALGQEVIWISYPHGDVNRRVRDMAEEAGYRFGWTSFISTNDANIDPLMLPRLPVLSVDGLRIIKQKINGDWDWFVWKQRAFQVWQERHFQVGRSGG